MAISAMDAHHNIKSCVSGEETFVSLKPERQSERRTRQRRLSRQAAVICMHVHKRDLKPHSSWLTPPLVIGRDDDMNQSNSSKHKKIV